MEAFKTAVVDAATRKEVSLEELCYDESPLKGGPVWSFRFKESAGSDWTSWDPWWNGKQARKFVDFRIETPSLIIDIELDENQHQSDNNANQSEI